MTKRLPSQSPPAARKRHASNAPSEGSSHFHSDTTSHEDSSQCAESHSDTSSPCRSDTEPRTGVGELTITRLKQHSSPAPSLPSPLTPVSKGNTPDESTNAIASRPASPGPCSEVHPSQELVLCNTPDAFPRFRYGDVLILGTPNSTTTILQLHSVVLARHSPWFARSFQEQNNEQPRPLRYSYAIQEVHGRPTLLPQRATSQCSIMHELSTDAQIKREDAGKDTPSPPDPSSSTPTPSMLTRRTANWLSVETYYQVLGTFYNIHPFVNSKRLGIAQALVQAEGLTHIASELGCLHLIRPFISNALSQYRQKLFVAIKNDPARWIKLSLALEDSSIYTESLVHLAGAHPHRPWRSKTVLPPELQDLIARKAAELTQMCREVDRDLLMITIEVGQDRRPVSCEDPSQMETWMTVQLFRNTIANRLRQMDKSEKKTIEQGAFYRKIKAGGSAYMDYEDARNSCRRIMRTDWADLGEDLKLLKGYASEIVKRVAKNELMIDPDDKEMGVGYLTCTKVSADDIPWASKETSTGR